MIIEATRANWGRVALADCCEIVSGGTPRRDRPEYWDGTIPWVTPKDLSGLEGPLLNDTPEKIAEAGYESSSAQMLPAGAVLFSSRAPIGLVAIAGCSMCTNQGFKSFVPGPGIDSLYLYYCLKHHVPQIQSLGTGATFKEVSKKVIGAFDIPVPCPDDPKRSLREQKRIAAILDKADAVRRQRQQAIQEAQSLIPAIFYEMFGDPGINEKGWDVRSLVSLCEREGQYGANTAAVPFDGDIRYIRITDITDTGCLVDAPVSTVLPPSDRDKYDLAHGDILFARTGATVGKTYLHREQSTKCVFAGYLIRFRPNKKKVLPAFLGAFTHTKCYWRWVEKCQRAVAQPNINAKQYGQLLIPIPPIEVQRGFATVVRSIQATQRKQQQAIAEADDLFNSLTQRAFKGEL